MKKVLIIVAALFVGIQANAQLYVEGGYEHFFEHTHNTNTTAEWPGWNGFFAGARYNFNLPVRGLSLVPGVNLSFMFSNPTGVTNTHSNEIALNIPIHVAYTYPINNNIKLRAVGGPGMQIGLVNNTIYTVPGQTNITSNYVGLGARNRFNLTLGLGAGVVISNHFLATLGFDFGLLNLTTANNFTLHRHALTLGFGYIF